MDTKYLERLKLTESGGEEKEEESAKGGEKEPLISPEVLKEIEDMEREVRELLGIEHSLVVKWREMTTEELDQLKSKTINLLEVVEIIKKGKRLNFYPRVLPMSVTNMSRMQETFILSKEKFVELLESYPKEEVSLFELMILFKELSLYLFDREYGKAGIVLFRFAEETKSDLWIKKKKTPKEKAKVTEKATEKATKETKTETIKTTEVKREKERESVEGTAKQEGREKEEKEVKKIPNKKDYYYILAGVKELLRDFKREVRDRFGLTLNFRKPTFIAREIERIFKSKVYSLQRGKSPEKVEKFLDTYKGLFGILAKDLELIMDTIKGKERGEAQLLLHSLKSVSRRLEREIKELQKLREGKEVGNSLSTTVDSSPELF